MIKTVLLSSPRSQSTKEELRMESFMVKEKWQKHKQVTIMKEITLMEWSMEKES